MGMLWTSRKGSVVSGRIEHIGDATLYLGDCLEILPEIGPVNSVVTDPPYGINYRSHHNSSRRGKFAKWIRYENFPGILGDDEPLDPEFLLKLNVPMAIFGGNYCADKLPPSGCWIVWDKRDGIGSNNQADTELIWTNFNKPSRIYRQLWSGLLRRGEENVSRQTKYHPNQKPVALMCWLIKYGGLSGPIADTHMGSGTTGVACARLDLKFIGIEIEEKYFDIACKRIENEYKQPKLFKPEQIEYEQNKIF